MGATYFFRDTQTLKMIPCVLIPLILEDDGCNSSKNINIWSAGCANGSEPYTLAILLKDILDEEIFSRIQIYATDIDPNNRFENIIKRGSYSEEDLNKVPEKMFLSNFVKDPDIEGHYFISEKIREHVKYMQHNLLSLKPVIESPFDVIVCKNVLLHFAEKQITDIINMFHQSLSDGGFFITEQTQKLPVSSSKLFSQFISNARIYKKLKTNYAGALIY